MSDTTITPQTFTNQQDIIDKANNSGLSNNLNVDNNGIVSGQDSDGNTYLLGKWTGDYIPNFNVIDGGSLDGNGAGNSNGFLDIPWWLWVIIGGSAFYLTRKSNDLFAKD